MQWRGPEALQLIQHCLARGTAQSHHGRVIDGNMLAARAVEMPTVREKSGQRVSCQGVICDSHVSQIHTALSQSGDTSICDVRAAVTREVQISQGAAVLADLVHVGVCEIVGLQTEGLKCCTSQEQGGEERHREKQIDFNSESFQQWVVFQRRDQALVVNAWGVPPKTS
jgi:hypothetical protein